MKKPLVIALISPKGGLGKSLTAIYTSLALAQDGYKVAALDNDTAQQTLCDFAPAMPGVKVMESNPRDLKVMVLKECKSMDFVFVDCGFGVNEATQSALEVADIVLVPCIPDTFELNSTRKFLDVLHAAQVASAMAFEVFVLLTRVKTTAAHESAALAAHTFSGGLVLDTEIPQRAEFETANRRKQTLLETKPDSPGALAYKALKEEFKNYAAKQN